MKEKIGMLILGIVIGVVLAGGCFWFAMKVQADNVESNIPAMEQMDKGNGMRGQRPENENMVMPEENIVNE